MIRFDGLKKVRHARTVRRLAVLLAVCVFCAAPAGCQKKDDKQVKERISNVRVETAAIQSFRPNISTVGTLAADEEVVVSAEIEGILKTVRVSEGAMVARGTPVASISDTDYRLDMQRSEAALKQAEATLENTKVEHKRKEILCSEELVTKQQLDDVATRLALAAAEVDRAKATLALAKERLSKVSIASPIDGAVKEKRVSAGDFVRNGTPLFTIIRIDPLKLRFTVSEKEIGQVRPGQDVTFQIDALPGRDFSGRVSAIYPHLDEKTRTLQVEATVPNRDRVLKPGLFARVTLFTGPPRDIVVVPVTAILYDNSHTKLFVVNGDKAHERPVKLGGKYGDLMEITEGLKAAEQVVVVGQNNLSEGVKVNVAR